MTTTLCMETSGAHCSLALSVNGRLHHSDHLLHRSHNSQLLGLLDELFALAGIRPMDLDLIAFGNGPGSFTGVRLSAAVSQAIAVTADCPVVTLSSSRVLAVTAAHEAAASAILCAIRSRGDAYYLSAFQAESDRAVVQVKADTLVTDTPDWVDGLMREGALALAGQCPPWLSAGGPIPVAAQYPDAALMVDLALAAHQAGESVDAAAALPRYLADDSPWRRLS